VRGASIVLATDEFALELVDHAINFGMFEFRTVGGEFKCDDVHSRTLATCAELSSDSCVTVDCHSMPQGSTRGRAHRELHWRVGSATALPSLLSLLQFPILYSKSCLMLRGTFRRKSLQTVRFLNRAHTTLGHEKERVVQFAANEFFGLFHSSAKV